MKKPAQLLVFVLSLGLTLTAAAQNLQVGVVGGLNFADLTMKAESGTEYLTASRTVFGAGGVLELGLGRYIRLDVEPMYLQKGAVEKAHGESPDVTFRMSSLEVPVFLKAVFGQTIRPYLKAGPTFGFVLSAEGEFELGGVATGGPVQVYKGDLKDVLESLDIGITVGAGVSYSLGTATLFVDGRYTFGLVDLYKGGTIVWKSEGEPIVVNAAEGAEVLTKGIQVMLGVTFPLGGD